MGTGRNAFELSQGSSRTTMSHAMPKPHIQLDLSAQEFKLVIRCLTGGLTRSEDLEEAHEFGVRVFDQYIRTERDRLKQLTGALRRLKSPEGAREAQEDPEEPREVPVVVLRPGSEPLGRYAHR